MKADPTLYKQKAINEILNKLKTNLKQIVKDTGKIDQIVANFRDDDEAFILNSYWDQISGYLKKFKPCLLLLVPLVTSTVNSPSPCLLLLRPKP